MTSAPIEIRLTNWCFQKSVLSKADAFSVRKIFDSADHHPGIDIIGRTSSRCQVMVDPVSSGGRSTIRWKSSRCRLRVRWGRDPLGSTIDDNHYAWKSWKSPIKILHSISSTISIGLKWNIKQPKWIKYLKFSRLQTVIEFSFDWTLCIKKWMLFKIL